MPLDEEPPQFTIERTSRFLGESVETLSVPDLPYLVKHVLPGVGVCFMVGPSGAGKSFIAVDWAMRIGSGMRVLDQRTKDGAVCYVAAEDAIGIKYRIAAWIAEHQPPGPQVDLISAAPNLLDPADMEDLQATIRELAAARSFPLRLVAIDTFSQSLPGADENVSKDMSLALRVLQGLAADLQCLVLAVAHTGKDEGRGMRGWSGLTANADSIVLLEENAGVTASRTLSMLKVKNSPKRQRDSFELKEVALGTDEDGDPKVSMVPVYSSETTSLSGRRRQKPPGPQEVYVVQAIDRTHAGDAWTYRAPPDDLPRWAKGLSEDQLKRAAGECGLFDADDSQANRRQKWHRAKSQAVAAGRLRIIGGICWAI